MDILKVTDPNLVPIDIIVISHERWDLLKTCVDAIYNYTPNPFNLIIVDDSKDMTPLLITELTKEHDNITYVHSDEPYKSGNQIFNIGLANCKYEYVATVMNSVTVQPEWTIGPLSVLLNEPKAATVGLKCLFPWGTIESAGIDIHTFKDYAGVKVIGYTPIDIGATLPAHMLNLNYERNAVQWALCIHRKAALIGNLAEDIYHGFCGWDDIDNCYVLKEKGWKIFYSGTGVGYHIQHATRGSNDPNDAKHQKGKENGEIFRKRWGLLIDKNNPEAKKAVELELART